MRARVSVTAEAAGVDGGEADAVNVDAHRVEDPPHRVAAEDDGEFLLALGARDIEDGPRSHERVLIEELDAAERDGVRPARNLLDGAQVDQVLADLLFRELVGRRMIELGELGDGADVRLDRAGGSCCARDDVTARSRSWRYTDPA